MPVTQPTRTSLPDGAPHPAGGVRVSVVIPTYNRAHLVGRAIQSVLGQSMPDLELIVVDDGSSDATADAVGNVDDSRLQYVRLAQNGGLPHARNAGVARARGEWVAFLDDDDEWFPQKLESQLARLEQSPGASAVYCRCIVQTLEGPRQPLARPSLPEGDITDALLTRRMLMTPSGYTVRRQALFEVGGFDETLSASADMDLWLRLCQAGHRFVIVPEPLFIYHAGDSQRMSSDVTAQMQAFELIDQRWGALMRERLGESEYQRWRKNRSNKLRKAQEKLLRKAERRSARQKAAVEEKPA